MGTSLAIQWLGLSASNAGGTDSISSQGTKIPHAVRHSQKTFKLKNIYINTQTMYQVLF